MVSIVSRYAASMAFTSDSNARNVSIFRSRSESFEDVCPYVSLEFSAESSAFANAETAGSRASPNGARFADVGGGRVISAQSSKMDNFASNIIGGVKKALDELLPRRAPHEEFCEDYCPEEW